MIKVIVSAFAPRRHRLGGIWGAIKTLTLANDSYLFFGYQKRQILFLQELGVVRNQTLHKSGLRFNHLPGAMVPGITDQLLSGFVDVVHILLHGGAPGVGADLVGASMVALPKDDRSYRPIAIGETIRHLAGRATMEIVHG